MSRSTSSGKLSRQGVDVIVTGTSGPGHGRDGQCPAEFGFSSITRDREDVSTSHPLPLYNAYVPLCPFSQPNRRRLRAGDRRRGRCSQLDAVVHRVNDSSSIRIRSTCFVLVLWIQIQNQDGGWPGGCSVGSRGGSRGPHPPASQQAPPSRSPSPAEPARRAARPIDRAGAAGRSKESNETHNLARHTTHTHSGLD